MGVERVINGVHIVPMEMANAYLIKDGHATRRWLVIAPPRNPVGRARWWSGSRRARGR